MDHPRLDLKEFDFVLNKHATVFSLRFIIMLSTIYCLSHSWFTAYLYSLYIYEWMMDTVILLVRKYLFLLLKRQECIIPKENLGFCLMTHSCYLTFWSNFWPPGSFVPCTLDTFSLLSTYPQTIRMSLCYQDSLIPCASWMFTSSAQIGEAELKKLLSSYLEFDQGRGCSVMH